jgi:hypothetical protein
VIFDDLANKTFDTEIPSHLHKVLYTAITPIHMFSIRVMEKIEFGGYPAYTTDHSQILIVEPLDSYPIFKKSSSSAKNRDIFTYFNSKISLIEHHWQGQI